MEPFQLDLFRGVVLGVTRNQFGDALSSTNTLCLTSWAWPGSENYDHISPALSHFYQVEREFTRSQTPTPCAWPRDSVGKSLDDEAVASRRTPTLGHRRHGAGSK
ncbi:hypothetical protein DPEC_G00068110 [Dallia pectoralis]|uniref:Uncharacterized protein n=1 Tax=Dallia pectoralis TaxID=75939 RepID=A0ACC2H1J1_DALPE|nr:hypothetical protein DPEC_G00068110 [Dallia pectoralis]